MSDKAQNVVRQTDPSQNTGGAPTKAPTPSPTPGKKSKNKEEKKLREELQKELKKLEELIKQLQERNKNERNPANTKLLESSKAMLLEMHKQLNNPNLSVQQLKNMLSKVRSQNNALKNALRPSPRPSNTKDGAYQAVMTKEQKEQQDLATMPGMHASAIASGSQKIVANPNEATQVNTGTNSPDHNAVVDQTPTPSPQPAPQPDPNANASPAPSPQPAADVDSGMAANARIDAQEASQPQQSMQMRPEPSHKKSDVLELGKAKELSATLAAKDQPLTQACDRCSRLASLCAEHGSSNDMSSSLESSGPSMTPGGSAAAAA